MSDTDRYIYERIRAFDENYAEIKDKVNTCAVKAGRDPKDVKLLAATKTVEAEVISHAVSSGIELIGENRVQELLSKYDALALPPEKIHFIGTLQTNKVHNIIGKVSMIQSVNSQKLASYISRLSLQQGIVTDVLVELNVGYEDSKTGADFKDAVSLIEKISEFEGIRVKGLMAIPPASSDADENKKNFSNMYNMFIDIADKKIDNVSMEYLSMGMSHDFAEAIECGANIVRIGTSLFGARNYNK